MTIKPTYEELERRVKSLEKAASVCKRTELLKIKKESIDTLIGGIAHKFNNYLYMILGNVELALEDIPKWDTMRLNLEEIKIASLKAAESIEQLLKFTRKDKLELKPIDIVTVIKDELKHLQALTPNTISIKRELPDAGIHILGDSIQIKQIMRSLCTNASQAMQETGGFLNVHVENIFLTEKTACYDTNLSEGKHVKIAVSDSGPGVSAEIYDRIFDPYFTTKGHGNAAGMGLTIAHSIVKNHDGAILVDHESGKGAKFNVFFPVI
jgi:signal transduction histidine kinase